MTEHPALEKRRESIAAATSESYYYNAQDLRLKMVDQALAFAQMRNSQRISDVIEHAEAIRQFVEKQP